MPKLQNVTEAEIKTLVDGFEETLGRMHDMINRMERGYCDDLTEPAGLAKEFALIARAASDMMVRVLGKQAVQEQKAKLNELMAERAALRSE